MIAAEDALERLQAGNRRFVADLGRLDILRSQTRRSELVGGQAPFAVILGCSDSRVPVEIIFDQGLGDLFVVRVAGNTVGNVCVGSVEYAVEHLDVPLVLVLGHQRCGVVETAASGDDIHHHLGSLVATAQVAIAKAKEKEGCVIDNAVKENVKLLIKRLETSSVVIHKKVEAGTLKIMGAYYSLDTGKVELVG